MGALDQNRYDGGKQGIINGASVSNFQGHARISKMRNNGIHQNDPTWWVKGERRREGGSLLKWRMMENE